MYLDAEKFWKGATSKLLRCGAGGSLKDNVDRKMINDEVLKRVDEGFRSAPLQLLLHGATAHEEP